MIDPHPFRPCAPDERPPRPRAVVSPEGVGDRMRTAAFAELQAVHAFGWAADRYDDAPAGLADAWRAQVADETRHLRMILDRMAELGVDPAGRPVSLGLWRRLESCPDARSFCLLIAEAEERGRRGGLALVEAIADRDPVTADVFRTIAREEEAHVALATEFFGWRPGEPMD
ncbi:ferritin-like domain-containing protein [bacterium]|nr:ferritin-like domain-containing protein [bacterium]HPF36295.1 ferritin-like domain-containing protein [Candidatus Krumholzibacteria bacterium]HRX52321.1 ferritin-like domain-containing protein [Candidatus Krumholzibacteria bacterium]